MERLTSEDDKAFKQWHNGALKCLSCALNEAIKFDASVPTSNQEALGHSGAFESGHLLGFAPPLDGSVRVHRPQLDALRALTASRAVAFGLRPHFTLTFIWFGKGYTGENNEDRIFYENE